ncbi:MAG: hypothetical protein K2I49_00860, partial [Ureaplasma sp.]|nr:hypothetical protein [Ureaplasma sp.]
MNNEFESLNKHFETEIETKIDDLISIATYILMTTNDKENIKELKEIISQINKCYVIENVENTILIFLKDCIFLF